MNKNITYITYQTFPGRTANSVQTISSLKYFYREGFKCTLIYPLRNKESSKNINDLKSFYNFSEDIEILLQGSKGPPSVLFTQRLSFTLV